MFIKNKIKKDWGKGIPSYNKDDIMTDDEIYDFALDFFTAHEVIKHKYEPIKAIENKHDIPSMILRIDGKLSFILIECMVAPRFPHITRASKHNLLYQSKKFNATSYYAPIGIGSYDKERFDSSLALKGDKYNFWYKGLEKIEEDSNPDLLEKQFNILDTIGEGYHDYKIDPFLRFLSENVSLHSDFSGKEFVGKNEVLEYFKDLFSKINNPDAELEYLVCQFDGNISMNFKGQVDGEDKNKDLYMSQENDKPLLLISQKIKDKQNLIMINCDFNGDDLITNINISSPNFFKLKF